MKQEKLPESSNQELSEEEKKKKSTAIINAFLIGFMIGAVIYGVAKNNIGFFTLILLFIVYKMFNRSKKDKTLENEQKNEV